MRSDKLFCADQEKTAREYNGIGYALLKDSVHPEFLTFIQEFYQRSLGSEENRLSDWEIRGKKQQYLFAFEGDIEILEAVKDFVAAITKLPRNQLTISERHIKAYALTAHPNPPPHKDRFASQINIGIPLHIEDRSALTLYPHLDTSTNYASHAQKFANPGQASMRPESEPTLVDAVPGDLIFFRGADIFHERRNAAGSVILYIKLNAMRLDPLAEDPSSIRHRQYTMNLLASHALTFNGETAERSPRILSISKHLESGLRHETLSISIQGEKVQEIDTVDFSILKSLAVPTLVKTLLKSSGGANGPSAARLEKRVQRLCSIGAIDLIPPAHENALNGG